MLRREYRENITFSIPISKELDNGKTITYKLKFIESFRFMLTSLSKLVKYLSGKRHSDIINQLIFRCPECKNNYEKDFNKELINRFGSAYEYYNGNINKFIFLLRKGVYPYEYMDSW